MKVVVKYSEYGVWRYEVVLVNTKGYEVKRKLCDTFIGVWWYKRTIARDYHKEAHKEARRGNVLGEYEIGSKSKTRFFRK
jgi:hypothetical protein